MHSSALAEDAAIHLGLLQRRRSFQGGIYLPTRSVFTTHEPIIELPCPPVLRIPLCVGSGPIAESMVDAGAVVSADEPIARAGAFTISAPCAGQVTGQVRVDTAAATDVPAIEIRVAEMPSVGEVTELGRPPRGAVATGLPARRAGTVAAGPNAVSEFSTDAVAGAADRAGIVDVGRPVRPLGELLRRAADARLKDVIINAVQPEPLLTGDSEVLPESGSEIARACVALRAALKARRVWIAIDRADRELVMVCRRAVQGTPVRLVRLDNKYPQSAPTLLVKAVTGQEVPYGRDALAVRTLVLHVASVAALADALHDGRPMTHRVVCVTGPAAGRPGHYRIPVGTSFADVIRAVGLAAPAVRVVEGGMMSGVAIESLDAVVSLRTGGIVLLDRDADHTPASGPCIRCGWCQEDCPVGLDPQLLLHLFETGQMERAAAEFPHACVECGLCSYVCPAQLPLADAAIRLKRMLPIAGDEVRSER